MLFHKAVALRQQTAAISPRPHQSGSALIISIVLLLILTITGISAVQSTTLEIRMASNNEDRNRAFQAAEYTLTQAKQYVTTLVENGEIDTTFGVKNGLYQTLTISDDGAGSADCDTSTPWLTQSAQWDDDDSVSLYEYDSSTKTALSALNLSQSPRFMIGFDNDTDTSSPCYSSTDAEGYSNSIGSTGAAYQADRFTITVAGYGSQPSTRVRLQAVYSILH
ncbi:MULTISPECIES: PilX N-terminal domain-containing pilus assembly protein [unclassified Oceanobacter]|uniref:pilus assembly PilX family protein n=1 Tax=unclassified Oceanobacter TaxID=2620260 RepID=UPI00273242EE|nr:MULTISPECIES: PilX N-terminal domain-containing pilus assembly protein [unclassified Oceanobacter]MDP2506239.1 PilX N-terminal domain-containing pilus assembly protein [Oceanobacter sp. 3_MG-2023]MDP2546499.1 PilX N-terminal domain-containing pilus assembly protein [Oceanobacter sp. 4_MG-2023]MDP2609829.1 PilX N-terminal domain-containing pilus assembly protein [Oceanobacter sp. 1_MG-2023]MDP2613159.1 PilX N-terminal domain-containing pilus assembly protein [Oceanobacter sp. 2_MG-2023]